MAQYTRLKKITDPAYIATKPGSEITTRDKLDGPTQEIADMLYSRDTGKGASQIGIEGTAYADVQAWANALDLSGTGNIPPANSVGLTQQATSVKTGLLTDLTTTDKTNFASAINEVLNTILLNESKKRKFVSLSDLNKTDATLTDVPDCFVSVESGKTYRIETYGKYQTTITTTGIKFYSYLPSGAGTILGEQTIFLDSVGTTANALQLSVVAIGTSGLTGSGQTTVGVNPINTDLIISQTVVFKCTSTGEFRHQFASEVAAASVLKAGFTVLVTEV